jgi:transcriptional regulator with XRE-family HTH domain
MTCNICGTKIIERIATPNSPYRYALSGLKNIFLVGITIKRCIRCGSESPVIPRIAKLNRLIAKDIAEKPRPLAGEELRYLRKYAGFSAKRFAALLEISPEHLSRIENGHTKTIGAGADKLSRVLGTLLTEDQEYTRKILFQIADDRIATERNERKNRAIRPIFKLLKNRWVKAA